MSTPAIIVCIGGAAVDHKFLAHAPLILGTSNPVSGHRSFGGVARNVAESLARLTIPVRLVAAIGDDELGRQLVNSLYSADVNVDAMIALPGRITAQYVAALEPDGQLSLGLADMTTLELLTPDILDQVWPAIAGAEWVMADCNLPRATLAALIERKSATGYKLAIDVVSMLKADRLPVELAGIDMLFLNSDEAAMLLDSDLPTSVSSTTAHATLLHDAGADVVVVTMGGRGCVVAGLGDPVHLPAVKARMVDVTGAGDALIAGTLAAISQGREPIEAVGEGMLLAALTIEHPTSVRPDLSPALLDSAMHRLVTGMREQRAWETDA